MRQEAAKEQVPLQVVDRLLEGRKVRVALAEHPVTGEVAPCVPYKDYAEVFSYDDRAILRILERSPWLRKHSTTVIMTAVDGKFRKQICMFEEAMLGVFMKLQPRRCKDPEVARKVDRLQEELILTLRDVLRGYRKAATQYDYQERILPRPGLTMDAISALCREADKYLKGKASLRALNYFTGMPVDDLIAEIEAQEAAASPLAGIIVRYLHALLEGEPERFGLVRGRTPEGTEYIEGLTEQFFNAFVVVGRKERLPGFFKSIMQLGQALAREAEALEVLGWRRTLQRVVQGQRYYRFEYVGVRN